MRIWRATVVSILLILSINSANAQLTGANITDFSQLVQAVESASDVRAIIHFDNCLVADPSVRTQVMTRLNGATTRFNFTHFFHAQERINNRLLDAVTTSMKISIENSSGELLVFNGRLSVFEDNTATLHVDFFDPILRTHQFVVDWQCTISNGQDNNGLMLFDFS